VISPEQNALRAPPRTYHRAAVHVAKLTSAVPIALAHLGNPARSPWRCSHPRLAQLRPKMAGTPPCSAVVPPSPTASKLRCTLGSTTYLDRRGSSREHNGGGATGGELATVKPRPLPLDDRRVGLVDLRGPTISGIRFRVFLYLFLEKRCKL
jgi:hypothetical protein